MVWKTQLQKDSAAVLVQCTGTLSLEDLTMLAIEAGFLVKEHQCSKVLVDLSRARLAFATDDLYELLDIYAEYHVPAATQTGIAIRADASTQVFTKFLGIAKSRHYVVELLVGDKQRDAWLAKTP